MDKMLTRTQVSETFRRIQALDPTHQRDLLFALMGRMSVTMPEALLDEVAFAERQQEADK